MAAPKGMGLTDNKPFTLRMTKDLKKRIRLKSKEAGLSMVSFIREALEKVVAREK